MSCWHSSKLGKKAIMIRVETVSRSTLAKQKDPFNTRKKENISYAKNFNPDKSALAKRALELGYRIN